MHSVFWSFVHLRSTVCELDVSQILVGISANLQLWCSWGQVNWFDFEVERLKVKVTMRPHPVKKKHFGNFNDYGMHSIVTIRDNLSCESILDDGSPLKTV